MLMAVCMIALVNAGCARYHQGRPGGDEGAPRERVVPEMNKLVEQNVKDPAKAKQVQGMIQEIVGEVRRNGQETRGFHEQLYVLNANYNANREQFRKILDELAGVRAESANRILETRFKIKELLTPQEWKDLTDAMAKARKQYLTQ
jgi:Glu-tRNA(Gln) amidotransferase subunit E-like FAD-binding protein